MALLSGDQVKTYFDNKHMCLKTIDLYKNLINSY